MAGTRDARVDAYIAKAAPFAQPILAHLRDLVHAACPDTEETIKWGRPFFVYRGQPMCMIAAFKAHAGFGLWRRSAAGATITDPDAAGQFGRLTALADLPPDATIADQVRKAMALIEAGARTSVAPRTPKPPAAPPEDLLAAIVADPKAQANFDRFAPGQRREYVDWIVDAKRPETRTRRIAQAVEWLAEGKKRNWKYENF